METLPLDLNPSPPCCGVVPAGAGVFGVETFLLPDGSVLLNEVAPRPHNSGHYTIEACPSSQFEVRCRWRDERLGSAAQRAHMQGVGNG